MDNLEVASHESCRIDTINTGEPLVVSLDDNVFCFISNCSRLTICEYVENMRTFLIDEDIAYSALQLKYLSLRRVVFVATTTSLLLYELDKEEPTVLYSFDRNITTTSWNPNESLLVVVDEINMLYAFTFEMNAILNQYCLLEVCSSHLSVAVPTLAQVGPDPPNTQPQGAQLQGAQIIEEENGEAEMEEVMHPHRPPVISWRGNGEQFAINYWNGDTFLKVFNRYLVPEFESKPYTCLSGPTDFKGQGNSIACAAVVDESNKILIFEKNCLVKSEFWVPENSGQIRQLQYHPDMNLLAVYSEDLLANGVLNIYLCSNAQWYLKQQIIYQQFKKLKSFHWTTSPDKTMCTLNVLTSLTFERIIFKIILNRYPENSLVAVVDGMTVHFTRFSEQIVPPPMSTFSLNVGKPVNKILFEPSLNLYQFLTSDNNTASYFYEDILFRRHSGEGLPNLVLDVNNNLGDTLYRIEKVIDNINFEFLLDRAQDLLINRSVVFNDVLSVYIHGDYLLFTHASSKLYCIQLTLQNLANSNWNLDKFYSREVEQGTKIVCVTSNANVIVQSPRGNLEAVFCRIVAVEACEKLLAQNKWNEAIEHIRQQRLNWNLLIDLNPVRFCEHLQEFIQAAGTDLTLMIAEFTDVDCLKTVYKQSSEDEEIFPELDKNAVLSKILDELLLDPPTQLINIVTLQLKYDDIKAALCAVFAVFQLGEEEICIKALKHLALHCQKSEVIREGHRLYDIRFMLFLYTFCSEDPRDFDPLLLMLTGLNAIKLRLKMNIFAENFRGATKYIVRDPKLDEHLISNFVIHHGTYHIAYENTCQGHPNFLLISRIYSRYLAKRGKYNEAGFILEKAELLREAMDEYKKALNWQQVLRLVEKLYIEVKKKKAMLLDLANSLVNEKRIDEAMILYEYHCGAHERAIEVLIDKKMFQKALCLAVKYDCAETIEQVLVPSITQYRSDLNERITELGTKYVEYTRRLMKVRQQKLLKLKFRSFVRDGAVDDDDRASVISSSSVSSTSSMRSENSRGSTASARNLRKMEKKKIDLREGGFYEDIALVRQLYILAINIFECGQDVKEVGLTLTDSESLTECTKLHEQLSGIQEKVLFSLPKIWSETFVNAKDSTEPEIMAVIQNRAELDPEYRIPPPPEKLGTDWKLLIFTR